MESIYNHLASDVIVQYASLLHDWMPNEATIAISMEDTYIYYAPKQIDIQIQAGQQIAVDSIAYQVNDSAHKIEALLTSPMNNQLYLGVGYPITISHKKGALIIVLPPNFHKIESYKPLHFITGRSDDEWLPIPIEEVSYFESLNKKNWCYQANIAFQVSLTMKDLANRLPDYFIRIHRSYIVNIRNISKITRDFASNLLIVMKDGQQLPVSQSYVSTVRKVLEF